MFVSISHLIFFALYVFNTEIDNKRKKMVWLLRGKVNYLLRVDSK